MGCGMFHTQSRANQTAEIPIFIAHVLHSMGGHLDIHKLQRCPKQPEKIPQQKALSELGKN